MRLESFSRRSFLAGAAAAGATSVLGIRAALPAARRKVTLLHIADTHAQLETHPEYLPGEKPDVQPMGGLARLRTAIDRERSRSTDSCFLVDSGDAVQGSGPAAWSEGEVVIDALNSLGLDAFVPGNWEVVYGPERFSKLMGKVAAPVIAYNFHDATTGERLFPAAVIIEKGGVKVAFVGIADPTTTVRQPPEQVQGLDSTRVDGLREYVKKLRQEADLVVAVTHTGLTPSRQIARDIPEFHVILSGHTHERTEEPVMEGKVIIVEPGSLGSFLGRLDLVLDGEGNITEHQFRMIAVKEATYEEHPETKALVAAALAPHRARMNRVVGHATTRLMRYDVLETNMDDFIADVVREMTGAEVGFTNGFRFAPPVLPGPVTEGDLWNMLPLDARMKSGTVTGKQLREYLESELELVFSRDPAKLSGGWGPRASGMKLVFRASRPAGRRVVSVQANGREVADEDRILIGGCERAGEPLDMICRLKGAQEVQIARLTVHEALLEYLKKHPVISTERSERSIAKDLPRRVFSQDAILAAMD